MPRAKADDNILQKVAHEGAVVVRVLCLFEKVLYSRTTQRRNENCVVDAKQSFVSVAHGPITTAKIAIYV